MILPPEETKWGDMPGVQKISIIGLVTIISIVLLLSLSEVAKVVLGI